MAGYFGLVLIGRVALRIADGHGAEDLLVAAGLTTFAALVCLGLLFGLAWLNARSAVYTLTNRRLVMRFGVAFPLAVNLPFEAIESADLRLAADGTGDLSVSVREAGSLGYWMMWPHARMMSSAGGLSPMLRCVPDARSIADLLGTALAHSLDPARRFVEADRAVPAALDFEGRRVARVAS